MSTSNGKVSRRDVLVGTAQAAIAGAVLRGRSGAVAIEPALNASAIVPNDYVIWDAHGHLSTTGDTPQQRMANVLNVADRMGIERVIVFMGYPWSHDPTPDEMRRQNDQVLQAIAHADGRAYGFVYLNPKHTRASLDELDRCVRDGPMLGVKLWVALHCNDERLDPIVTRATQLKAPVLQHTWSKITGNLPGESTAKDLAELATRHPDASFIAAHSGGDWEIGIRAIRATKNVVAEICGGDPTAGFVEMAVRELGERRVIYGSDYAGRSFASQLAKVFGANIADSSKRLILAGNIKRLLAPICAEKGISL